MNYGGWTAYRIAVGRKFDPDRWDAAAGRAIGTKADTRTLNAYLDDMQFKICELQRRISEGKEFLSAEYIKIRFSGKTEKARTLVSVFEDHNAKMKVLVGAEFEKSTLQRYETCRAIPHGINLKF